MYSRDARDAAKHGRAREWVEFLWDTNRGRVSRQVLHEYYVTVTRKLRPGRSVEEARSDVRTLGHWLIPVDPEVSPRPRASSGSFGCARMPARVVVASHASGDGAVAKLTRTRAGQGGQRGPTHGGL